MLFFYVLPLQYLRAGVGRYSRAICTYLRVGVGRYPRGICGLVSLGVDRGSVRRVRHGLDWLDSADVINSERRLPALYGTLYAITWR